MHSHANAVSGSIDLTTYRLDWFGNPVMLLSDTVAGPATVITESVQNDDLIPDTYRVTISHASGDDYHLSIHGEK